MKYTKTRYLLFYIFIVMLTAFFSHIVFAGGGGSPSPPPPPPPPCSQQAQGCYDTGSFRANPGSLSIDDFGYYLGQNACIGGGCSCSAAGFVDEVKQLNPDNSSGACSCISGSSWDSVGHCCGDDRNDCGITAAGSICSIDANFRISSWIPAESNTGDIFYLGCMDKEVLSDGTGWQECNSFEIQTLQNHEYMCTGAPGEGSWVECCGSGACNSRNDGLRLSSGKSVEIGQTTYYCASDNTFTTDLDVKDQQTCQGAGLGWTGSLCCSEADDPQEYYTDPAGLGGCWNKEAVFTGDTVSGREDIANFNGIFFGCNLNDAPPLEQKDSHTGQILVQNKQSCFQDPNKFYFCSFSNKWELSGGQDRSHLSTVPQEVNQNPGQLSECCSATSCWDGQTCIANQANNPNAVAINGLRCINGEWAESGNKFTPDGRSGFCPDESQCLVNPAAAEDRCISDGDYTEDNYCEEGIWTSRTKYAALQLVDIADDDYVLFCDTPENTLNNLDYLVQGQLASNLVSEENTNNFCVLLSGEKVIVGASLNKQVIDIKPFLRTIGVENCNSALIGDGQYHSCDASNKAWYNQELNTLIYSDQGFQIGTTNFLEVFISFIKTPFDAIKNAISGSIEEPFDTSYLNSINRFDKLYLGKQGNKEIRGSIEETSLRNLVLEYRNFNTDICLFIDEFNRKNQDPGSGIECSKQGNTYYVLAQGTEFTKINPDDIWNDLTSKLRVS